MTSAASDRRAFLNRLQQGQQQQQTECSTLTQTFLRENDLESIPIDPISLKALDSLIIQYHKEDNSKRKESETKVAATTTTTDNNNNKDDNNVAVEASTDKTRVQSEPTKKTPILLTPPPPMVFSKKAKQTNDNDVPETTQDLILQHLEQQTQMILHLQQQVNHLSQIVINNNNNDNSQQQQQPLFNQQTNKPRNTPPLFVPPPVFSAIPIPRQQQPPPAAAAAPRATLMMRTWNSMQNQWNLLQQTKVAQVTFLLIQLYRRHVRLDLGMMLKVVFMVAILAAKTMNRKKSKDGASPVYKIYLIASLVFVGFFIQAGFGTLLQVLFKENYIARIYRGEAIDLDEEPRQPRRGQRQAVQPRQQQQEPQAALVQQPPQQLAQPQAEGEEGENNALQVRQHDNLLVGEIPRPEPENGFRNAIMDIVILVGSLFLSILPMWKPEGPPRIQQEEDEVETDVAVADIAAAAVNEQQPPNQVAPPRDLNDFAADSSDDEEEDAGIYE